MILLSLSTSAPYLATPHLSLHRIGCKHIPSYFEFPIVQYTYIRINSWFQSLRLLLLTYQLYSLRIPKSQCPAYEYIPVVSIIKSVPFTNFKSHVKVGERQTMKIFFEFSSIPHSHPYESAFLMPTLIAS